LNLRIKRADNAEQGLLMKATRFTGIADAKARLGQELGLSDWMLIDQERINAFAEVTGDRQWIHVDVERAKRESPFGAPIAHGYLTLSLLAKFANECISVDGIKLAVNYGLNRVRFASPVKAGSRVRARFVLAEVDDIPGGAQLVWQAVIEIEGGDKPACAAEMVTRWYF
jgi:acyl dehydratase